MFDKDPFGNNPPPKPPCDHEYEYSVYFEAVKETYIAKRECVECGETDREEMNTTNEEAEDLPEEQIKRFFRMRN